MSSFRKFIIWLNTRLVRLYPAAYQEAFADEMQDVFSQVVSETSTQGNMKLTLLILREIRDSPVNLIREHWLNLTRKETVMVTNSPTINVNACPRCGTLRPDEARYCLNCGRAFIPFHVSMVEKLKHLANTKPVLVISCLAITAILGPWGAEMIFNKLYHPVSLIIFSILVAGFSVVLGWRLARKKSNRTRLLVIVLVSVIVGLAFIGLESLDQIYLRSVVNENQTLSYNFLGLDTFITISKDEKEIMFPCFTREADCSGENLVIDPQTGRTAIEHQELEFVSSVCEGPGIPCMIRHMNVFSDTEKPKILVERAWKLYDSTYFVLFIAYTFGLTMLAYRISRKRTANQLTAA